MNKKWLKALFAGALSASVLAACGESEEDAASEDTGTSEGGTEEAASNEESGSEDTYVIGATQIVEHPSLDAAYEGFKEGLADNGFVEGENVEYDHQSAQGDQNNTATIANNFISEGVDLIFANSTPSAQAALQASNDTPIIFTSVTDAVEAGLIDGMDTPGELITGVVDLHPDAINMTVDFISEYFPDSTVGMVYNSGEQNSVTQIEAVEEAATDSGLEVETRSVSTSAEVQQATESLVGEADLLYIITDNTVVSALESVVGIAESQSLPLIVGEPDSLERGGFATFGINYHDIGYRAGEMAAEVLSEESTPADIPAEYPQDMELFINREAGEAQGVDIHEDWEEEAQFINGEE
ncbi:ABC transporter substrate-binding protein [Alteribacillus iranensis]|uniref:Putative ABC transport system substrate-binding protein n=1 Tax=Alteribacillus iranensis TaxID=930128 RepID=A0A1I2CXB6_9BACI|nr:ABC transporter substrate-binding protein [Alteribacillus iranensis]SFE72370.1 putative ABC transport system substrate-binding protein [Alteribacillus iranensis]